MYNLITILIILVFMVLVEILTYISFKWDNNELKEENENLQYELDMYRQREKDWSRMKELGDNFFENHDIDEAKELVNIDLSKDYQKEL